MTKSTQLHNFFIPVMGTGFTLDSPLRVAQFGISSVLSLVDDVIIEQLREYYCKIHNHPFIPIPDDHKDKRSARITSYLDFLDTLINKQISKIKEQTFDNDTDLTKYFEMLPDDSPLKLEYESMKNGQWTQEEKENLQKKLKEQVSAGSIDVNIMTKLDCDRYEKGEKQPQEQADALSALRGYANSVVKSAIVFSAGLNRRLYSYVSKFDCFFHKADGSVKKEIILKVSDYRSALTQGKVFAKKGLWVSEYRIESGLNCGGHAFPTNGKLLGSVLKEFKDKRDELIETLHRILNKSLQSAGKPIFEKPLEVKITAQGGVGTAEESKKLMDLYGVNSVGWGTPFLLVPEATCVDPETRDRLVSAKENDLYMSNVSPLNVLFQNLRTSKSEEAKNKRIANGITGSTCPKGYLKTNTEFSQRPICTASRAYQERKIAALKEENLAPEVLEKKISEVTDKSCICHELGGCVDFLIQGDNPKSEVNSAVCPGPNLAFFDKTYTLKEMVDHIYGRTNVVDTSKRPNVFIGELKLYIEKLEENVENAYPNPSEKEVKHITSFAQNIQESVDHYESINSDWSSYDMEVFDDLKNRLKKVISLSE